MKSTPSFTAAAVTFTAATVTAVAVTAVTVTASAALDHARAEIERMARAAGTAEGARGWWHAVRIVRLFGSAARASRQCARHARFFSASAPEKAAAYRGAMVILARHTGESLADFKAGPAPKKKTKKGGAPILNTEAAKNFFRAGTM